MENIDWKADFLNEIDSHNVCGCYHGLIERAKTFDDTLKFYKRGIDWCLRNNSPSIDCFRKYKEQLEPLGIYIDRTFNGEEIDEHARIVFLNCNGNVIIRKSLNMIPEIYLANGSNVQAIADDGSQVELFYY